MHTVNCRSCLVLFSVIAWGACATPNPPKELVDARDAFAQTERGKAREYDPAALHEAKVALDRAEASFEDEADSERTRDEAYVAMRQAQKAEISASTAAWRQRLSKAKAEADQAQAKRMQSTEAELATAKERLQQEQTARAKAEAEAKSMLDKLDAANAAAVKEEARGTVITLAGGVLFASGKSTLLPGAQTRLSEVANALKKQENKLILIEGHTDSTGTEARNLELSKARADSVAAFFASRGVPSARMTTSGLGPSRPVADNGTPEGRANNRRVEIVIQNAGGN